MKTFTTTLALVLSATVMMAFPRGSELTVELLGHRPNTLIVVNGQKYSAMRNSIHLDGLQPGNYPIQVLRPTYWGNQGVVFKGVIRIPNHADVTASISRGQMKVRTQSLADYQPNYWDGNNSYGQGVHHTPSANGNGGFVSLLPHNTDVVEPIVSALVVIGMHPDIFERALRSIELQSFDSDQIRVSKQVIRRNGASSQQIAEIMQLLSFESSRLEVAKFGYEFVGDPRNYHVVNDVFWFSSSIRELDRYINNY